MNSLLISLNTNLISSTKNFLFDFRETKILFRSSEIEDLSNNTNQLLRITIKFLNETQKSLLVQSNDTILKIKRLYFADQLTNNQIIRLIYQGRELRDSRTLRTYNIRDETIIHCLITTRRQSATNHLSEHSSATFENSTFFDTSPIRISSHLIVFLTFLLAFIWYLRVEYRLFFTSISTIVLLLITIVFLIFTCGPFLSPSREHIYFD